MRPFAKILIIAALMFTAAPAAEAGPFARVGRGVGAAARGVGRIARAIRHRKHFRLLPRRRGSCHNQAGGSCPRGGCR